MLSFTEDMNIRKYKFTVILLKGKSGAGKTYYANKLAKKEKDAIVLPLSLPVLLEAEKRYPGFTILWEDTKKKNGVFPGHVIPARTIMEDITEEFMEKDKDYWWNIWLNSIPEEFKGAVYVPDYRYTGTLTFIQDRSIDYLIGTIIKGKKYLILRGRCYRPEYQKNNTLSQQQTEKYHEK